MIEPLRLDEQTRPRWEAIKRFATSRANGGQVLIKSFLQDNDRLTGFAQFLRNELDIVPIILAPEDDPGRSVRASDDPSWMRRSTRTSQR